METFYVLSFQRQADRPELWFWMADGMGYTDNLLNAGVYTREQLAERRDVYHTSQNNVVLPTRCLALITADVKGEVTRDWPDSRRLVVNVIPRADARGHLLEMLETGMHLEQLTDDGLWHWRLLWKPSVQEQEPLKKDRL